MINFICIFAFAFVQTHLIANSTSTANPEAVSRAQKLKDYIQKERSNFETRETQKRDILGNLDRLNAEQNNVRERISTISTSQSELAMALENLAIEFKKQQELQQLQRHRLFSLLKVAYRIKKDGMLRFILNGQDLTQMGARVRVLYRTLRSHTLVSRQLEERSNRLAESENRLKIARQEQQALLDELHDQEVILSDILDRKSKVLKTLNKKQNSYQMALREYKRLSAELTTMFNNFPSIKEGGSGLYPSRGTLNLPVDGRITQGFGKVVNKQFGTVIYHKGIEIEAVHNSPVNAVLAGTVEYAGWVRGLGNVVIVHHGSGFYTLNAHLFRMNKSTGNHVDQGDVLGTVGDTGNNDRPSLYFEIRENGKAVDPIAYFSPTVLTHLN